MYRASERAERADSPDGSSREGVEREGSPKVMKSPSPKGEAGSDPEEDPDPTILSIRSQSAGRPGGRRWRSFAKTAPGF